MLRGLQVTGDEPDPDSHVDHLCRSNERAARQQIQQAVKMWHSLNSVYRFCLHTDRYQIIWGNNHGSRRGSSEELPHTMTGKEVTVTEGEVVHIQCAPVEGMVRLPLEDTEPGEIPPSAARRQVWATGAHMHVRMRVCVGAWACVCVSRNVSAAIYLHSTNSHMLCEL